ncbi:MULTISPECIES: hypothetical protein [Limnospira]|uniref:hypothetical protein n=1 Tax=Limnospira TaxID=2596745 RepID=UPI00061B4986|nr:MULTISPECIES: hypothetical protein [unclassified Limnospira]MDT9187107.1 hypothetical protein [Limnospira sp. PMC 894.15]MDT9233200.1 hypothetical protein [Limnospira sp. PMC 917.15]MDY7051908.1 hypothetical protein [Limnospira fusiformis LS22]QJB26043.1 hypothetical protein HFV01_09885 [Limnospira fusiformis SAG 85.79]
MNDSDKIFGIPKSLAKIIAGLVVFLLIAFFLSSQVCIFSTCTTTTSGIVTPELAIGGVVALILMSMFPIPLPLALLSGCGVWFLLHNLGWFQMH